MTSRCLTVAMLAAHWGTSTTFVYNQINTRKLDAFKLGNQLYRITPAAVEEYEQQAILATQASPTIVTLVPEPATIVHLIRAAA